MLATGAGSMIEKDEEKVKVNVTREFGYVFDDGDLSMTSTGRRKKIDAARSRCLPPALYEERAETQ